MSYDKENSISRHKSSSTAAQSLKYVIGNGQEFQGTDESIASMRTGTCVCAPCGLRPNHTSTRFARGQREVCDRRRTCRPNYVEIYSRR